MRKSLAERIVDRVAVATPTNAALLSQDLGVPFGRVSRAIATLIAAGRLSRAWDGVGVELTADERADRQLAIRIRAIAGGR